MISDSEANDYSEHDRKSRIVRLFSVIGIVVTASMGALSLGNGNPVLSISLFLTAALYFSGFLIHKKTGKAFLSSIIVVYSLLVLMIYLVYTGGVEGTGPLWIFMVPAVCLVIDGLKRGLVEITLFLVIVCIIFFAPNDAWQTAAYSVEFKLRIVYSFITVAMLSTLYEYSIDRSIKHSLELSKKYEQLANSDPLTKLSNRRDALNILALDLPRIARSKEASSIILCDIDHFKQVNDKYGHNAGDVVLVELANLFAQQIREQDTVARWGGEEFLFILPHTEAKNAGVLTEKIHHAVRELVVTYDGQEIKVTVSMGVAQLSAGQLIDEVINRADKNMYQAKDAGRNQTFPLFT